MHRRGSSPGPGVRALSLVANPAFEPRRLGASGLAAFPHGVGTNWSGGQGVVESEVADTFRSLHQTNRPAITRNRYGDSIP